MQPVPLTSGAYQAKSIIANAQRCVNLYPESNPADTKPVAPVTHYPRPGKALVGSPVLSGTGPLGNARGLYTASNGRLFALINDTLYYIDPAWQFNAVGNIVSGTNPVSMADNGQFAGNTLVLVDGSPTGYIMNMTTLVFAPLVDSSGLFTGADVVTYLSTFFLFNTVPNTQNWIISQPDSATFDPLDIAGKATYPDNIVSIGVRQREVWLIGEQTTEPWFISGAVDFPFEAIPSTFVSYGCIAKYGVGFADINLFWISRNSQGKAIIVKSEGYAAKRISTHAIEAEIQSYDTIEDAIFSTYQSGGHTFVLWTFPSADKTYAFDLATNQWHQLAWSDDNGNLHRDRVLFYAQAYGSTVGIDWENGQLYRIDPEVYTDNGSAVQYIRGIPTLVKELNRVTHWALRVYAECGTIEDPNAEMPMMNMVYSDDGGKNYSDPLQKPLGATGQTDTLIQYDRLGMARQRVYELFWTANAKTALNGVYVEPEEAET